jgi:DNA-3-methyladenine glycosylase
MITETEAYKGIHDRASHAYRGRKTERTRIMFEEGGIAYVYLCYGMHSLFNIVTNKEGVPDAILIRGIRITHGAEAIRSRLNRNVPLSGIVSGPGLVSRALGITTVLTGLPLIKDPQKEAIWLEDGGVVVSEGQVSHTPRIGVDYAGEDALLPYRYVWIPEK